MCRESSNWGSFLATFSAVREETPEPQAFVVRSGYFIGKGRKSCIDGEPNLEVVYHSLAHNIDLTFLKGCMNIKYSIPSGDVKETMKITVLLKGKEKTTLGKLNNQNNYNLIYSAENGWGENMHSIGFAHYASHT